MKIATLVLSILGALAAIALGAVWLSDAAESSKVIDTATALGVDMSELVLLVGAVAPAVFAPKTLVATFLLILAAVFAFLAKPKSAAAA